MRYTCLPCCVLCHVPNEIDCGKINVETNSGTAVSNRTHEHEPHAGFELVKQNQFAKNSEHSKEKCCCRWNMFAKNVEKFVNHFMENAKSLTKF